MTPISSSNTLRHRLAMLLVPLMPALLAAETPKVAPAPAPAAPPLVATTSAATGSIFVRFVEDDAGARLQTGVASYRNDRGITVDLIGAVHVADEAYFRKLNERFKGYEIVLYEMVGGPIDRRERRALATERAKLKADGAATEAAPDTPKAKAKDKAPKPEAKKPRSEGAGPTLEERVADLEAYIKKGEQDSNEYLAFEAEDAAAAGNLSWIQSLHTTLQNTLALKGQMEIIDYHAPNFVHADMSLTQFADMQAKRKEGFLSLWFKAVQAQMAQPQANSKQPGLLKILEILCRQDSSTELKRLFGRTFDSVESVMAGMETGDGTVIVTERNKVALEVLDREIESGRNNIAIFYGAAHLPDMEKRLLARGFKREANSWETAWDLPPPPPEPAPVVPAGADPSPPAATPSKEKETRQNP